VPQDDLVDALFREIDKSLDRGEVHVDERKSAEGAAWLKRIEDENADELTPERIARMEAEGAKAGGADAEPLPTVAPVKDGNESDRARTRLDEEASPVAGRRFTRT
jgi:(E)-4-hydroxy-3-methylbut-2-enyl-diphosphate synthase